MQLLARLKGNEKKLNDPEIRQALTQYLFEKNYSPKEIFQELHVCNGKAIADLVTIKGEPHCYEIKGDNDKLERVLEQNEYYKKSFRRLTLVTTEKYLIKAKSITPDYWGIIVVKNDKFGRTHLKTVRKSRINQNYDSSVALLTLWKSELLKLIVLKDKKTEKLNRKTLATLIAETKKNLKISQEIGHALASRLQVISQS